jgi:hypothetical protein
VGSAVGAIAVCLALQPRRRQAVPGRKGVERVHVREAMFGQPGQRAQRQAEAGRAVTRQQKQAAAAGGPVLTGPAPAPAPARASLRPGLRFLQRQHEGGRLREPALEHARQTLALHRILQA